MDGKNISDDELYGNFIFEDDNKPLKDTEYACLLSHLKALSLFKETKYINALILEDDMILEYSKYWNKTTKTIMDDAPKDWDIIMLAYITLNNLNDLYTHNANNGIYSTGAYIINKNGVNKLFEKIYDNNKFILLKGYKHTADDYLYGLLITYAYKYPYFTYASVYESTVHVGPSTFYDDTKKIAFNNTWGKIETFTQNNTVDGTNNTMIYIILLFIILLIICYLAWHHLY